MKHGKIKENFQARLVRLKRKITDNVRLETDNAGVAFDRSKNCSHVRIFLRSRLNWLIDGYNAGKKKLLYPG
jgi:hypothetical protein